MVTITNQNRNTRNASRNVDPSSNTRLVKSNEPDPLFRKAYQQLETIGHKSVGQNIRTIIDRIGSVGSSSSKGYARAIHSLLLCIVFGVIAFALHDKKKKLNEYDAEAVLKVFIRLATRVYETVGPKIFVSEIVDALNMVAIRYGPSFLTASVAPFTKKTWSRRLTTTVALREGGGLLSSKSAPVSLYVTLESWTVKLERQIRRELVRLSTKPGTIRPNRVIAALNVFEIGTGLSASEKTRTLLAFFLLTMVRILYGLAAVHGSRAAAYSIQNGIDKVFQDIIDMKKIPFGTPTEAAVKKVANWLVQWTGGNPRETVATHAPKRPSPRPVQRRRPSATRSLPVPSASMNRRVTRSMTRKNQWKKNAIEQQRKYFSI